MHTEIELLKKEIAAGNENKYSLDLWVFYLIGKVLGEKMPGPSELPGVGMKIVDSK